jgi:hypothetical protein
MSFWTEVTPAEFMALTPKEGSTVPPASRASAAA